MKTKWDERYSIDEYYFGKEPNFFLKEVADSLPPGKALFIGEGEGRNAVYAATLGWQVDAFDVSEVGKRKADNLAKENNVEINYKIEDALSFSYPLANYDSIVLIYFHIKKELREEFYKKLISALKPNGKLILLVYDEDHIKNNNHGPQDINMLYTLENVAETFIELEFNIFGREEINRVKMGVSQKSTVIKFVGTRYNNS